MHGELKVISVRLPETYIEIMDELVKIKVYPSRSEIIRMALRDFLRKELRMHRERMKFLRKI